MVIAEERWIASNPRRPYFAASRPASTSRKSMTASRSQSRRKRPGRDAVPALRKIARTHAPAQGGNRLGIRHPADGDDLRLIDPLPTATE